MRKRVIILKGQCPSISLFAIASDYKGAFESDYKGVPFEMFYLVTRLLPLSSFGLVSKVRVNAVNSLGSFGARWETLCVKGDTCVGSCGLH